MNKRPPIGLSGFAGTGKTEAANYLQIRHGYTRLHIAEPLRDMLAALLRRFGMNGPEITYYLEGGGKESVIPCLGVTSRSAQISLGTEWGRRQVHDDLWVDCWKHTASNVEAPMNDSVRFPNEEIVIRGMGGFTIRIVRPERGPAAFKSRVGRWLYEVFGVMWGVHDSERVDRLRPDYLIYNTGSVQDLHKCLDNVVWMHEDGMKLCTGPIVVRPDSL